MKISPKALSEMLISMMITNVKLPAHQLRIRGRFDAARFDLNSQDEHEYNSL